MYSLSACAPVALRSEHFLARKRKKKRTDRKQITDYGLMLV